MGVTVVVGGQFGSEGKGKVAQYVAATDNADVAVRIGGPNSGHTGVDARGESQVLRQLPTAALLPDVLCVLGPGSYIDPVLITAEMSRFGVEPDRVIIDGNAVVIEQADREREEAAGLRERIGSTLSGTGSAVQRRVARERGVVLARDVAALRGHVRETTHVLRNVLRSGGRVVVEGTQGFGLSVLHSPHYPYATSRDTSAAGAISEAGLSPRDVDDVILVIRAHPIRVAGTSGPLPNETDWPEVAAAAGLDGPIQERTSVTQKVRRVAEFDAAIVRRALDVNNPTRIVLNHVDYVDGDCRGACDLTGKARTFISRVSREIGQAVNYVGVGPEPALIELSRSYAALASS